MQLLSRLNHCLLDLSEELGVFIGITIDDNGVGLKFLGEHTELHEVSNYDRRIEGMLQNLRIGFTSHLVLLKIIPSHDLL